MLNVEYQVVTDSDLDKLVELVNEKLTYDWECQGGICTTAEMFSDGRYLQAMVRKTVC